MVKVVVQRKVKFFEENRSSHPENRLLSGGSSEAKRKMQQPMPKPQWTKACIRSRKFKGTQEKIIHDLEMNISRPRTTPQLARQFQLPTFCSLGGGVEPVCSVAGLGWITFKTCLSWSLTVPNPSVILLSNVS